MVETLKINLQRRDAKGEDSERIQRGRLRAKTQIYLDGQNQKVKTEQFETLTGLTKRGKSQMNIIREERLKEKTVRESRL